MRALRMASLSGTWTIPIGVTCVLVGAVTGGLAFHLADDSPRDTNAATVVSAAPLIRAVGPGLTQLPSLGDSPMALRSTVGARPVSTSSESIGTATAQAGPIAPVQISFSIHDAQPAFNAVNQQPFNAVQISTGGRTALYESTKRLIAEEAGATRVISFESQPLLSDIAAFANDGPMVLSMNHQALGVARDSSGQSLAGFGLDLIEPQLPGRGAPEALEPDGPRAPESSAPNVAEPDGDDDEPDAGISKSGEPAPPEPEEADDDDLPALFATDGDDLSVAPAESGSAPAPGKTSRPPITSQPVPEPMVMPILLGGWILLFRSRRRRDELARLQQLLEDSRSFKLPPGSSDRTLDQLSGRAASPTTGDVS